MKIHFHFYHGPSEHLRFINIYPFHACAFGLFTKGIPDIHEFQPKRGKKQEVTFPIKEVMDILKISHRQAQAYHQAGLLVETVDTLYYMKLDLMRASIVELSEENEKKE